MTPTPNTSDTVTPVPSGTDSGPCGHGDPVETTDFIAEEVSPPPAVISEHRVLLATAAAVTEAPTFDGELDGQDDRGGIAGAHAEGAAAPQKRGWFAALARRIGASRDGRPPRRHYPRRLDFEFVEDARMDREMYRL